MTTNMNIETEILGMPSIPSQEEIDATVVDNKKVYKWGTLTDTSLQELIATGTTNFTKDWFFEQFGLPTNLDDLSFKETKQVALTFFNLMYNGVMPVMLKKHCMMIESDPKAIDSGFLVIPPHEQARYATKKATKKAKAAINRGLTGAINVDENKLDEGQLKDTIEQRTRFMRLDKTFSTALREFKNVGAVAAAAKARVKPNFAKKEVPVVSEVFVKDIADQPIPVVAQEPILVAA